MFKDLDVERSMLKDTRLNFVCFYGDHAQAINVEEFKLLIHVCMDNLKLKL